MSRKEKIKVLVVLPFLSGEGGTETVVNEWISHFENSSYFEVTFLLPQGSLRDNWYIPSSRVKVFKLDQAFKNVHSLRNILGGIWLAFQILKTSADEVICLSTKLIFEVSALKKIFRKSFKVVSWIHFSLHHGQDINLDDLRKADFHLAISSGIQDQMNEAEISSKKISIINNPISRANEIIPKSTGDRTRFVYVGRIFVDGQKNLRELVSGLIELHKYSQQWTLDVFGDGPDMDKFQELLTQEELLDHVILHGWVKQPFKKITHADCLVLTSKYEGFPMVLGEAISRGIPVVSSDCPTGPADIVNKNNGYLYKPGDISMLARELVSIVNDNKKFNHNNLPQTISNFYLSSYFHRLEESLVDVY